MYRTIQDINRTICKVKVLLTLAMIALMLLMGLILAEPLIKALERQDYAPVKVVQI